ncbi:Tyrosinase-like protein orsC like [Verticillium longisporum]|uniref:Tyrosinase-like protein orsC like n=1 Tax=Verticillium longisporum TaxID=100787 RepID=A0A8I3A057_VERLO|nr:Tyrosinase-like protein orsC like [Verticillium longisporum]
MLLSIVVQLMVTALLAAQASAGLYPRDSVDRLQDSGMKKLKAYIAANPPESGCTIEKAIKRKEWRLYIKAVKCLHSRPSKYPRSEAPGARSRFDDFVVTHVQQTISIHGTANFLSWHRYFVWAYEKALREECGYRGYQPYEHWPYYASNPHDSPLFDGSDASMSSDGSKVPHAGYPWAAYNIPPGDGGGCIMEGPFKDFKVNLGPMVPFLLDIPANPRPDGLGYNPRCIRRDINRVAANFSNEQYTYDLITKETDISSFQTVMQGDFNSLNIGVHGGSHFMVGGDPGGDFYISPGDPSFYLHHAMIDRVWWIWQLRNLDARLAAVAGLTFPSDGSGVRNGTLDDPVDLNVNGREYRLGDLLDTMNGPFCYIYV